MAPVFLVSTLRHSLPLHIQKGKGESDHWDARSQVRVHQTLLEGLEDCVAISSHKTAAFIVE